MSIQSEVARLESAKSAIAGAITAKGVTVPDTTKLDGYADLVAAIQAGGMTQEEADKRYLQLSGGIVTDTVQFMGDSTDEVWISPSQIEAYKNGRAFFRLNSSSLSVGVSSPYKDSDDLSIDENGVSIAKTLDLQTNRIANVANPTAATDAVNKQYVDNLIGEIENGSY